MPTLANPHFDLFARERIIDSLAQKMALSDNIKNFLKLLIKKSRMNLFSFVCDEYHALANDIMGRVVMTVVSAVDLPDAQYDTLKKLFSDVTGKAMVVKRRTDPDILGGVRVHVKDKVYDYTIASQLEKMKQSMLG